MKFNEKNLKDYIQTKFELEMLNKTNITKSNLKDYINRTLRLKLKLKNYI